MTVRGLEVQQRLHKAEKCLTRLVGLDPTYTPQYFEGQWDRQRTLQKAVISKQVQERQERLAILLSLEESLFEAWYVS